jgi:protein tyrosine/serine phosphatase
MSAPPDAKVAKILAILNDESAGPVFVHCRRGADRTGTVIACYRISHDHWDNRKALDEARSMGMSFFERSMQSYVARYRGSSPAQATVATQQ